MNLLRATIATALVLGLCACNEPPTEVGSAVIFDTTRVQQMSSTALPLLVATRSISTPTYLFNAGVLYIGQTPELHATTLLRFTTLPDTLGWITANDIISATLLIRPHRYVIGDSITNLLAFSVHQLQRAWITADSAGSIVIEPRWYDLFSADRVPNPLYFDPTPLALFDGSEKIPLTDSLKDVEIPLTSYGLQIVTGWLQKMADTNLRKTVYGIGFVPSRTSTVVREFETQPVGDVSRQLVRLRIVYRRRDGITDSLMVYSGNDATFVSARELSGGVLPIQSVVRSEVAMTLDLSTLPPLDAVLNAQLTVWTDTTQRLAGNYGIPTTMELAYRDSTTNYSLGFVGGQQKESSRFVFPNIGPLVDYLRQRKQGRGTVLFRSRNFRLERLALYGTDAPDSLRPRLVITYIPRLQAP
ncbi:MAG: hypothetical protein N2971_04570 [Chlorobi bacterium]|nr:hypothetical protein [Chlorobiota bacterium]